MASRLPLADVPPNLSRHDTTVSRPNSKRIEHGNKPSSVQLSPPTRIRSMLKTSTELGDSGIFAQRPSRIPRSSTHRSLTNESDASARFGGQVKQSQHASLATNSRHRPRSSISSSLREEWSRRDSMAFDHRTRWRTARPLPRQAPSHLLSPQRPPFGSFHRYRPSSVLKSRDQAVDGPYRSSRGPLQNPRASTISPALSSLSESHRPFRRQTAIAGSIRSRTSSASMPAFDYAFHDHRTAHNGSVRSLRTARTSAVISRRLPVQHNAFSRIGIPSSEIPVRRHLGSTSSIHSAAPSTISNVPAWYDYSESFVEEDEHSVAVPAATREPPSRNNTFESHAPQSTRSAKVVAELPALQSWQLNQVSEKSRHNRHPSCQSRRSHSPPNKFHAQNVLAELPAENELCRIFQTDVPPAQANTHCKARSSAQRNAMSQSQSMLFSNASRSPRNLCELAARTHSPTPQQRNSDVSFMSVLAERTDGTEQTAKLDAGEKHSSRNSALPVSNFPPIPSPTDGYSRPSTAPVFPSRTTYDIVCPSPDRPVSSQSRDRFTKILDIEHYQPDNQPRHRSTKSEVSRLEKVVELTSPPKRVLSTRLDHANEVTGAASHYVPDSLTELKTHDTIRSSVVTSDDPSTIESLLDKHIECLGLTLDTRTDSIHSSDSNREHLSENETIHPSKSLLQRSSEELLGSMHSSQVVDRESIQDQGLVPLRLFAGPDGKSLNMFVDKSIQATDISSSRACESVRRPSYGWQTLASQIESSALFCQSRPTILSGEFADLDTNIPSRSTMKRRSSLDLVSTSSTKTRKLESGEPERSNSLQHNKGQDMSYDTSKQHRKMRIHLGSSKNNTTVDQPSMATKAAVDGVELAKLGMSRVPISTVDGFAELGGDSMFFGSQVSIPDVTKDCEKVRAPPSTIQPTSKWSSIISSLPMPPRKAWKVMPLHDRIRRPSDATLRSVRSQNSITKPENTSRFVVQKVDHEVKVRNSVPQLADLDFGPAIRPSQFDLGAVYQVQSPRAKPSMPDTHISLPETVPQNTEVSKSGKRCRIGSLRRFIPRSSQNLFRFPPAHAFRQSQTNVDQVLNLEQLHSPDNRCSETLPIWNCAYQKHRVVEGLKMWWNRQCLHKHLAASRKRYTRTGVLIE